ncbi:MAG: SDR family oxidoreductase [Planctomycetaceae bacterium]|jgi:short-subunit dehydrogenase|nr:SDR family oxidoreductase [Planctomycetaceae bacterium]
MPHNERHFAVITGASSGLGKSYAHQLAEQGHDLLLVARRGELLRQVKTEIEAKNPVRADIYVADLADEQQTIALAEHIRQLPRIDYLINNAGFGLRKMFPDVVIEEEIAMIRVHCEANVRLCQAVLFPMREQKRGNIINVASLAAYLTGPAAAEYCATKAFLRSFSISLQDDVQQYGVKIQAFCPGFVHTGFHDSESMKGNSQKQSLPACLWLNCDRAVRDSLRAIQKRRHRVVVIPSLRYKLIFALNNIPIFSALVAAIVKILFKR